MEEDGTTHVIADSIIAATSVVTVAGDMSSGTYYFTTGGTCAVTAPTTAGTGKITMAADNLSGTALLSNANTAQFCHLADGATGIPAGGFTFSVAYTTATGTNAHADNASAYGSVSHNGSTSQVPYLTTFEDYNQRLVIVNRSTADADYTITFTTETDTTATAGTAATGTVTAQSVLSIKASDIVTLTGKTRTAATVVIVGPPASIEVATNQVNLSDGSTDTVKYTVQ